MKEQDDRLSNEQRVNEYYKNSHRGNPSNIYDDDFSLIYAGLLSSLIFNTAMKENLKKIDKDFLINISSILDYGCGHGAFLERFESHLKKSILKYGVDIYKDTLDKASARLRNFKAFHQDFVKKVELEDGSVDIITFNGSLMYIHKEEDLNFVLYESHRLLSNNGYILIHDFFTTEKHFEMIKKEVQWGYDVDELERYLISNNFEIVNIEYFGKGNIYDIYKKFNYSKLGLIFCYLYSISPFGKPRNFQILARKISV